MVGVKVCLERRNVFFITIYSYVARVTRIWEECMSRTKPAKGALVKVYRSVEELPEVLEPGRYIIASHVVEVREPVSREEIAYQLRVQKELPKAPTV